MLPGAIHSTDEDTPASTAPGDAAAGLLGGVDCLRGCCAGAGLRGALLVLLELAQGTKDAPDRRPLYLLVVDRQRPP